MGGQRLPRTDDTKCPRGDRVLVVWNRILTTPPSLSLTDGNCSLGAELVSILDLLLPLKSEKRPFGPTHPLPRFGVVSVYPVFCPSSCLVRQRKKGAEQNDDTGVCAGKWSPEWASTPALTGACAVAPGPLHISHRYTPRGAGAGALQDCHLLLQPVGHRCGSREGAQLARCRLGAGKGVQGRGNVVGVGCCRSCAQSPCAPPSSPQSASLRP